MQIRLSFLFAMRPALALGLTCVPALLVAIRASDDLCGATVYEDVSLDQDLTCAGTGLIVGADDIKVNLKGHTITGSGSGVGISLTGRMNVSIFGGGTVKNFEAGVRTTDSTDIVVKDLAFVENGDGVDAQSGSHGNTIKANGFWNNRTRGIMLRGGAANNHIKENTFTGNRVGILVFGGVENTIKGNTFFASTLAGIRFNVLAGGNLLLDNTLIGNPAAIEFIVTPTGWSTGNTLMENRIALNTCGIKGPTDGNILSGNVFEANGADSCS